MGPIDVSISEITDIQALAADWSLLESRVNPSYFLSWAWTGTWLSLLPQTVEPKLLTARLEGEVVALAVIISTAVSGWRTITCPPK